MPFFSLTYKGKNVLFSCQTLKLFWISQKKEGFDYHLPSSPHQPWCSLKYEIHSIGELNPISKEKNWGINWQTSQNTRMGNSCPISFSFLVSKKIIWIKRHLTKWCATPVDGRYTGHTRNKRNNNANPILLTHIFQTYIGFSHSSQPQSNNNWVAV